MKGKQITNESEPGHSESELLKMLLTVRDIPCPVCGYNLRAISSANCPECGATLDLRVGSTDLKIGPWLACVLSAALPLGFSVIMTVIGAILSLLYGLSDAGQFFFLGGLAIAYSVVLIVLIKKRRVLWSRPRRTQVLFATWLSLACWVAVAIVLAVMFYVYR